MSAPLSELVDAGVDVWRREAALRILVFAGVTACVTFANRNPRGTGLRVAMLILAFGVGGWAVWTRASVVDDAFVALRYARNLAEGQGLVFNPGERVEGYTDFLWVLLLAAAARVGGLEPPVWALVLNGLVFAANLAVSAALGRRVAGAGLPLAALVLATNAAFVAHATTGLETGLAALLVQLGAFLLCGSPGPRSAAAAGLALTLAVLTRPDAMIWYGAGGLAVLAREGLRRDGLPALAGYIAPFSLQIAHLAWTLGYYGDYVPNTWYAKSAGDPYWSQGFVYALDFLLGGNAWALLGVFLAGLVVARRAPTGRTFGVYAGVGSLLQIVYVLRVGGDFMAGRFFVPLLPLWAAGAELAVRGGLGAGARWRGGVLTGLLAATAFSTSLRPPSASRWMIADEGTVYPVSGWSPLTIGHPVWPAATTLERTWTDRGIMPYIATGTIGMTGYYSRLRLLDTHGLTDAEVAHQVRRTRGYIGHEKRATMEQLQARHVNFLQTSMDCDVPKPFADLAQLRGPAQMFHAWCIVTYDRALMRTIRERAPEWRFTDAEVWLDTYIAALDTSDPEEVQADLTFLDRWYFAVSDDPARRTAIQDWLDRAPAAIRLDDQATGSSSTAVQPPPSPSVIRQSPP